MKLIYMAKTLELIAKTKGVKAAKDIEALGTIEYMGEVPYLVIKIKEENLAGVNN